MRLIIQAIFAQALVRGFKDVISLNYDPKILFYLGKLKIRKFYLIIHVQKAISALLAGKFHINQFYGVSTIQFIL